MPGFKFITVFLLVYGGLIPLANAGSDYIVDHVDSIVVDPQLSLSDLVKRTLQIYPDYKLIAAMQQQSNALNERGNRWIAGSPTMSLYYRDDFAGSNAGSYEFEGTVQVPLWNWGQRDAGLHLAEQSQQTTDYKAKAVQLKVAGLVREAVWLVKLENLRHEMSKKAYHLSEKLLKTVQRRVDLGDLPRTDYLLAQSELLQKKTELLHAESELMHARKQFFFLTQDIKLPAVIEESVTAELDKPGTHPKLLLIDKFIAQKRAKVEWVKAQGSGQNTIGIGGNTERGGGRMESSTDTIVFTVSVPFGGRSYIGPQVATATRALIEAETQKQHLQRALLKQEHEAEHALQMETEVLEIAQQMQSNAYEQLKMANLSFSAGEINLMDFLKIQAIAHNAIKNAQESGVRLQRDIALYNQAVGVMP